MFWMRGDTLPMFRGTSFRLGDELGLTFGHHADNANKLLAVKERIQQEQSWLLVIDNIANLSLFTAAETLPFVPRNAAGTVLWLTGDKSIFDPTTTTALGIQCVMAVGGGSLPPGPEASSSLSHPDKEGDHVPTQRPSHTTARPTRPPTATGGFIKTLTRKGSSVLAPGSDPQTSAEHDWWIRERPIVDRDLRERCRELHRSPRTISERLTALPAPVQALLFSLMNDSFLVQLELGIRGVPFLHVATVRAYFKHKPRTLWTTSHPHVAHAELGHQALEPFSEQSIIDGTPGEREREPEGEESVDRGIKAPSGAMQPLDTSRTTRNPTLQNTAFPSSQQSTSSDCDVPHLAMQQTRAHNQHPPIAVFPVGPRNRAFKPGVPSCPIGRELRDYFTKVDRSSDVTVTFDVDWHPRQLVQAYGLQADRPGASSVLLTVVTVTGTLLKAEATSMEGYLQATWPDSWAPMRTLVYGLLGLTQGEEWTNLSPESTSAAPFPTLRAKETSKGHCSITVSGSPDLVAATGEQLAWLAASMRVHPEPPASEQRTLLTCTPALTALRQVSEQRAWVCRIVFETTRTVIPANVNGACWASLFHDPVVVGGYPVHPRPEGTVGLEIPIELACKLLGAEYGFKLHDRVFIKAWDKLLVVTKALDGSFSWHLVTSGDPNVRVSYNDPRVDAVAMSLPSDLSYRLVQYSRHFIGWSEDAMDLCAHPSSNFEVGQAFLDFPKPLLVLERIYLEAGYHVIVGATGAMKDRPPIEQPREKTFEQLIHWMQTQVVICYDIQTRRAWLVRAVSALLLLVRRDLRERQTDDSDFIYRDSQLTDAWGTVTGPEAAFQTLKDLGNRQLQLYGPGVLSRETLEERAMYFCLHLEAVIEGEVKVAMSSQVSMSLNHRLKDTKYITGWNLHDIRPLANRFSYQQIQYLNAHGSGWTDLVRSAGIAVIFGNGFGDLIRPTNTPSSSSTVCPMWATVPTGLDLLGTTVATMSILQKNPFALSRFFGKFNWVSRSLPPLRPCSCTSENTSASHDDLLHYFVDQGSQKAKFLARDMEPVEMGDLNPRGAIVFGHVSVRTLHEYEKRIKKP